MQRIILTAAVVLVGGLVTTANAEQHYGPITDGGKGLCFSRSPYNDLGFGYWTECPKPAATTTTVVHRRHVNQSLKDAHGAQ